MQQTFASERDFVAQFLLPKMKKACEILNIMDIIDFSIEKRINSGISDLVMERARKPVLVLEAKSRKKIGKVERDIEPRDPDVVKQAMNYAVIGGYPFYATCNFRRIVLFQLQPGVKIYESEIASFEYDKLPNWAEQVVQITLGLISVEPKPLDDTLVDILKEAYDDLYPDFLQTLRNQLNDTIFAERFIDWIERQGLIFDDDTLRLLASQSTYMEINKFLFYHIIRIIYPERLSPLIITESQDVSGTLRRLYNDVLNIDYAPIYETTIISELPFTRRAEIRIITLLDTLNDFDFTHLESDFIGQIYEKLIPPSERKRLGQFYTPQGIVEYITQLTIKNPNDVILDPGCGSGSFLIKAFHRLRTLKGLPANSRNIAAIFYNKKLLDQIFGIDINQFPAHLSVINLAIQNPRAKIDKVNVLVEDFFNIKPGVSTLSGFFGYSPEGKDSEIILPPYFDVVIGNPPYIRQELLNIKEKKKIWKLIESEYKDKITFRSVSKKVRNLISMKKKSDIYIYFFIHGLKLLKNNGKLGFISSNKWLEVSYGEPFQNFLLTNTKILYVVEFDRAIFPDAEVNTAITILEKENKKVKRDNNIVKFIRFKSNVDVDIAVNITLSSRKNTINEQYSIANVKQSNLKIGKWNIYLRAPPVFNKIINNKKIIIFSEIAKIKRAPTTGNNEYFIMSNEKKSEWDIEAEYLKPCLSSPKKISGLIVNDVEDYIFQVSEPKSNLIGTNALKYIEYGENFEVDVKRGSQRGKRKLPYLETLKSRKPFWYSLNDEEAPPILFPRLTDIKPIFLKNKIRAHTPHVFYYIYPKNETDTDILLAFLNSSLTALLIELFGRSYGGGVLELLVYEIKNLPVLNPSVLDEQERNQLIRIYNKIVEKNELKRERQEYYNKFMSKNKNIQGLHEKEAKDLLNISEVEEIRAYEELDQVVFSILGFSDEECAQITKGLSELQEMRRLRTQT